MAARGGCGALVALVSFAAVGCGQTTEPVLERIQPIEPPELTQRVDVFLLSHVEGCAVGRTCTSSDPNECFSVGSSSTKTYFEPPSVEFVAPDDPRVASAPSSACFALELGQASQALATGTFSDLRRSVYQLSAGSIDLDVRVHLVAPDQGDFKVFEGGTGIFLQPAALESAGLPLMSPDSDFVFAVTGETNGNDGPLPRINPCAGTNWQEQGALGGTAYTWLSTTCLDVSELRWHLLYQAYFALRDVMGLVSAYPDGYPACIQAASDPLTWFPRPSDCRVDPDAPTCGQARCDETAFAAHVLTRHWPTDPPLIGNHCRNGRTDYDETAPDRGGVCDALGR